MFGITSTEPELVNWVKHLRFPTREEAQEYIDALEKDDADRAAGRV